MVDLPVLLLPKTRREVVLVLEQYLREEEGVVNPMQLKELQEPL